MSKTQIRNENGSWAVTIPSGVRGDIELGPGARVHVDGYPGVGLVIDDDIDVETRVRLLVAVRNILEQP